MCKKTILNRSQKTLAISCLLNNSMFSDEFCKCFSAVDKDLTGYCIRTCKNLITDFCFASRLCENRYSLLLHWSDFTFDFFSPALLFDNIVGTSLSSICLWDGFLLGNLLKLNLLMTGWAAGKLYNPNLSLSHN